MTLCPTVRRGRPLAAAAAITLCAWLWASRGWAADGLVTAPESSIRSAPFEVAPEMLRVQAGQALIVDDQPQGTWRRVRLPDGRFGYLHDTDVRVTVSALPPPGNPLRSAAPPPSIVAPQPTAPPQPAMGPTLFGVMFELLPVGTLAGTFSNTTQSTDISSDSLFAVAVAPFLDVPVLPQLALGFSPQVIFRVKGDGSTRESAREYDLRARITGRMQLSPKVDVYGRLSPAYSVIDLRGATPGATSLPDPTGLVLDFAVGTEIALLPNLFLVVDLGYQVGYQSSASNDGTTTFDGSRYLHLGAGLAVGL